MMLLSDSVGGAEDSRNGFVNFRPVNVTEMSFICRIIGKAERVSTVNADVLRKAATPGQIADTVARNDADRGMPNFSPDLHFLQE